MKAFISQLPGDSMSGPEKFLAMASLIANGSDVTEVPVGEVQRRWRKTIMKVNYNPALYHRAQIKGWVNPTSSGMFIVSTNGLDHLSALRNSASDFEMGALRKAGGLIVVNHKGTHSFDKYLRQIFQAAEKEVLVADAWVGEATFDNVLDVVPKSVPLKLIWANLSGSFEQRAKRFAQEFSAFSMRRYKRLHDRFMVVDQKGYVLGPSIKDAASQSPAIVVELVGKEKRMLRTLFEELWGFAKPEIN
jgi:hypothetical protein